MASQGDPMRARGGAPPPAQPAPVESIDFVTLLLSAIASASAAYITSKIWGPGTLFSAAFAPVIVALVKEGLRRPTEKVANVVPSVATVSRWSRTDPGDPGLVAEPDPAPPAGVHPDPDAPHVVLPPVAATETTPVRVYSTRARRLRWRLALVTGLLGFAIAVVVFTVPELIAGESLGGSHKTTIFGGHHRSTKKSTKTTTSTTGTTTTGTTATQTQTTATVTQTVTTPAPATTPTTTTQTPTTPTTQQAPPSSAAPSTTQPPP
jgi:hypothetical protein